MGIVAVNRFIWLSLVWFLSGFIILIQYSSVDLHLVLNKYFNSFADHFFYYATILGDGIVASIITLICLFINLKKGIIVATSWLIASGITQLLKRFVFEDAPRPFKFFQGIHDLHLVPGLEMNSSLSFPSGHSTAAFALYCALALVSKNKSLQVLFFLLAVIAAYSRVYLSQHFFIDIYVGSLIGTLTSIFIFILFAKRISERLSSPLFKRK